MTSTTTLWTFFKTQIDQINDSRSYDASSENSGAGCDGNTTSPNARRRARYRINRREGYCIESHRLVLSSIFSLTTLALCLLTLGPDAQETLELVCCRKFNTGVRLCWGGSSCQIRWGKMESWRPSSSIWPWR